MYLADLVLEFSTRMNPYDFHRKIWQFFDLPPGGERPFQFRVEQIKGSSARILMQSSIPIQGDVAGVQVLRQKAFSPVFSQGQHLHFRLKANPIKTIKDERGRVNSKGKIKSCRVPLIKEEEQLEWLSRKLEGAATLSEVAVRSREHIYFRKGKQPGKVVSVIFEGVLSVEDSEAFTTLFSSGIGPAKSLGCGLLSLAPT